MRWFPVVFGLLIAAGVNLGLHRYWWAIGELALAIVITAYDAWKHR